jgi:hypothetical protein
MVQETNGSQEGKRVGPHAPKKSASHTPPDFVALTLNMGDAPIAPAEAAAVSKPVASSGKVEAQPQQAQEVRVGTASGVNLNAASELDNVPSVSYWGLFHYANAFEKFLLFLGVIGGCCSGACMPLFAIIFGCVLVGSGCGPGRLLMCSVFFCDSVGVSAGSLNQAQPFPLPTHASPPWYPLYRLMVRMSSRYA